MVCQCDRDSSGGSHIHVLQERVYDTLDLADLVRVVPDFCEGVKLVQDQNAVVRFAKANSALRLRAVVPRNELIKPSSLANTTGR